MMFSDVDYQEIARWLTAVNVKDTQNRLLQERKRGTGLWFLESQTFIDWRDGISTTLWCPGARKLCLSITSSHRSHRLTCS